MDVGSECALVAEDPSDQVTAHLCAAKCYMRAGDLENTVESYLKAISITKEKFSLSSLLKTPLLPLDSLLTISKLLQQYGRYEEAVLVLLYASQLYSSASVCLQLGVNYLRLNKESEAEKALMEANLLDNRNSEVWAMLSVLCVRLGPRRVYEAEQCLFQALRLGLSAPSVLRELALAFMSIDKLQVAEDLLRRSIACDLQTRRIAHPHSRKLLADVLAGQNLAAKAVEEYKAVLLDEDADPTTKRAAADKCLALLASLGRDEELDAVKNIVATLEGGMTEQVQ
ncbi:hypothetical protein EON65_19560 [archaeon]|nr:MAG: hypothetical protein EON65_19560 [archaeon]